MSLAHHPVAPSELWSSWAPDPVVVALLGTTVLLYHQGWAALPARRRAALGRTPAVGFGAGMAAVAVALASPLEVAAVSLFSWHMGQHLVLMVVAAPLLALGRPTLVLGRVLPVRWRRRLARLAAGPAVDALRHPATVWAVGAVVLWAWHLPALYEAALADDRLHALEHVTLLTTSAAVWHLALHPNRRASVASTATSERRHEWVGVALLFATSLQSSALGAVLALAPRPLYAAHEPVAPLWGMTPLEDQQLAGVLMWVPPGLLYLGVIAVLLARWLGSFDGNARAQELVP